MNCKTAGFYQANASSRQALVTRHRIGHCIPWTCSESLPGFGTGPAQI